MTWDAYHRRKELLREIFAIADRRTDLTLTELLDRVDPDRLVLEDETAALFEIQMVWFQRLSGHVDRLTAEGAEIPELVAVAAWVAASADLPGARAVLDAYSQSPQLATAFAKERAFIAASAGVPAHHPDLGAHGARIISAARVEADSIDASAEVDRPEVGSLEDTRRHGLIARLRSVIAA